MKHIAQISNKIAPTQKGQNSPNLVTQPLEISLAKMTSLKVEGWFRLCRPAIVKLHFECTFFPIWFSWDCSDSQTMSVPTCLDPGFEGALNGLEYQGT
jgi:hypothetical protein